MSEQFGDKSQDPTPHRREQAREHGQSARSQDLGSSLVLLGGLLALTWFGGELAGAMADLVDRYLAGEAWLTTDIARVTAEYRGILTVLATGLLPILAALLLVSILSGLMQVGIRFLPEKLFPDLARIDPLKGFARLFSLANVVRLGFGLVKVLLVVSVAYLCVDSQRNAVLSLAGLDTLQVGAYLIEVLMGTGMKVGAALLLLGILDYGFQWWRHEQDLRMTGQEVREELRNLQGDPQVAARRRAVQRQLAINRLSKTVPKADVVITNPTELAVAIQYDAETMPAPVVVAKGAGILAQRIRRLALEHGIPIVEKKPLARALYKDVEVQQPIGHDMYAAVAEVLAYVYQLKGKSVYSSTRR